MHVRVDAEKCIGSGQCVFIAPEVFDQDDDGTVVLLVESIDALHEGAVLESINVCPARVIAIDNE